MAISQAAIQRYLSWRLPAPPPVKAMPDADLYSLIKRATGVSYTHATEPRRQQLAGQAFLAAQGSGLLFFGMRTGKTKIVLDRFNHLRKMGSARKGIIIVPNPVIRPVWVNESALHTPHLNIRAIGNNAEEFVDAAEDPNLDLVVASWSSLQYIFCSLQKAKKGKGQLIEDFGFIRAAAPYFDFGAIDEIHGAKDHESLRYSISKTLLVTTTHRIGCTGTPFGRDPYGLWSQANLIDNGKCLGNSFHFFRHAFSVSEYCHFSRSKLKLVYDKTKNDMLADKVSSLALSYTMFECGVEKVKPNIIKLEMTSEQKAHYIEAAEALIAVPGTDQIRRQSAFAKLRMISSGYVPFVNGMGQKRYSHLHGSPKLDWLEDLADSCGDANCVIFHDYEETGRMITAMLKKRKIKHAWLYGGTSDKLGAVEQFRSGAVNWFVINVQSGNAGIDLRRADYQCFFESPTSPILRQQAEARALGERGGRGLVIDDLVCSRMDQRVLEFHAEGVGLAGQIVFRDSDLF